MFSNNHSIIFKGFASLINSFLIFILATNNLYGFTNPDKDEREAWFFGDKNTSETGIPSNLQFFKYYDMLPDEISAVVFKDMDVSGIQDKKLYVGYGVANPSGNNCKVFTPLITGLENNISICLPWWRIEREYEPTNKIFNADPMAALQDLKQTKPPIRVEVCKSYEYAPSYPGGRVICTSYYDKLASDSCWDNPQQGE